jgi:hypothetical protein
MCHTKQGRITHAIWGIIWCHRTINVMDKVLHTPRSLKPSSTAYIHKNSRIHHFLESDYHFTLLNFNNHSKDNSTFMGYFQNMFRLW